MKSPPSARRARRPRPSAAPASSPARSCKGKAFSPRPRRSSARRARLPITTIVMAGLDPAISIPPADARIKSAHDADTSNLKRLDDLLDHLLGVPEQHHRVVAVEQRIV